MDSTTLLDLIESSQAQKEVTANNLFDAASPATAYGRHAEACAGLTWGYYGTRYGGTPVANGTNVCGASTTTYMVANLATGAASFATSTTNWDDDATYGRCYKIVTGTDTVTSYEDHRFGPGGIFAGGGSAAGGTAGTLDFDTDGTLAANSDALIATQKATRTYVDAKLAGLSWKQAVRVATTANGTLASAFENGDTVDGVVLATGNRILIKNQSSASENGIYVVAASGAPARATDADSSAELVNASVYVSEGTANADTQWTCTTNAPITVGSTSLAFAQLASGSGITALTGDVTASGTGSVAATIANDAVTNAKLANVATQTIKGRTTASTGDPEDLTAAQAASVLQGDGLTVDLAGFRGIPQNSKSAAYTTVAADAGKHIFHPAADTTARIFTIDSNANVAYPVGTALTFINQNAGGVITISITSDTMRLAGAGTTGSRTLAANGIATAIKVASTEWLISGTGLS